MLAASRTAMATQQIHQGLNAVWAVVAEANRYFAGEAPWALAKTDPARQKTVLYVTAEVVRQIAILAQPVMPDPSAKLLDSLGVPQDERDFAALGTRIRPGNPAAAGRRVSALCRTKGGPNRWKADARRQPLPSRLSRFRRGSRRHRRARRDRRDRPHRHHLDPGEAARRAARDRRAISERLLLGRHPSAPRR